VAGSCERGNEISLSIKYWEILAERLAASQETQLHGVSYVQL
jgi:hypothetical protein